MDNQLLLKHNFKSNLHTFAVCLILLFLPIFLFLMGSYMHPNENSIAYLLTGFGVFVSGLTIIIMRRSFINGLKNSPVYIFNEFGIQSPIGTVSWSSLESAVLFSLEKERNIGFRSRYKHTFESNKLSDIVSQMEPKITAVTSQLNVSLIIPLNSFTVSEAEIVHFVKKRLALEIIAEPFQLRENYSKSF